MKKIFPLLLTILIYSNGIGQNFNAPELSWDVAKQLVNTSPNYPSNVDTITSVYGYTGDTIIENQTWQKLSFTYEESLNENSIPLGFIQQEEHIVSFKDTNEVVHQLYNFNLNIGDSVLYFEGLGSENNYLFVEYIDSILINGTYKKQFHFSTSLNPPYLLNEIWIEDIGSIHGPLFPINPCHFSSEMPSDIKLTCCFFEDDIIWDNPDFAYCYYHSVLPSPNFIEEGKQWNVRLSNFENYITEILLFMGDSIIDNVNYKKLYTSYDSLNTLHFKALIREENNKVYLRHYNQAEALIYDFNLTIGESTTIYSPEGQGFIEITVNDISWVEYEGFFRKKYTLDGNYEEYWMEGIGSCFGPIYSKVYDFIVCPDWMMSCAYNEEGQIYQYQDYPCYDLKTGINEIQENKVVIYPNPIQSGQVLQLSNPIQMKSINIFDYSGQLIISINYDFSNQVFIPTDKIKKGIYIIKIEDKNGKLQISKLIVS
ncbi:MULTISPECIES: T9SS type A sorting domain-containing protein [unclassified Lentimicrobium]|uniref:T9SS type A sorting domain-containing protein n=1 Tax=unclassified Lentimicrobium TaxID=2677434 RepID=UPI001556EBC5|nr:MULTISPECIES: T9SS type A sorting domain-containing protein [unclassified Lentimicrobium]NPD46957.1 T9SS type A sorting domain-containing protein [Lentimicrobium sp. S6]NPD84723.1 T9SS type A sorting domain-containing protein [Lentimicrobium sp. L6]